jgi:hypothetical protein
MTSLAILSFVAGAVLGLWFRVSVLALATSLAPIVIKRGGSCYRSKPMVARA